jgi:hypothetical protein
MLDFNYTLIFFTHFSIIFQYEIWRKPTQRLPSFIPCGRAEVIMNLMLFFTTLWKGVKIEKFVEVVICNRWHLAPKLGEYKRVQKLLYVFKIQ